MSKAVGYRVQMLESPTAPSALGSITGGWALFVNLLWKSNDHIIPTTDYRPYQGRYAQIAHCCVQDLGRQTGRPVRRDCYYAKTHKSKRPFLAGGVPRGYGLGEYQEQAERMGRCLKFAG